MGAYLGQGRRWVSLGHRGEAVTSEAAVIGLDLDQIGDRLGRFRLQQPGAERAMAASLRRYGQVSPVVVFVHAGQYELVDGFKRRAALREVDQASRLTARVLETDQKGAKVAMLALNGAGRRVCELEEAWIVFALVREDQLAQIEVAQLLGRAPSWVCRRLALIEKLGEDAREELRLGLLSASAARHVTRLPRGNQRPLLDLIRNERLSVRELGAVVDLLLAARDEEQRRFILDDPREALLAARTVPAPGRDPRLSTVGVQVWRRLGGLFEALGRMDEWFTFHARTALTARDRLILAPRLERLARDASSVAIQCREVIGEWQRG
jgi:ParB-like chromosome segregation protein Spo0J